MTKHQCRTLQNPQQELNSRSKDRTDYLHIRIYLSDLSFTTEFSNGVSFSN